MQQRQEGGGEEESQQAVVEMLIQRHLERLQVLAAEVLSIRSRALQDCLFLLEATTGSDERSTSEAIVMSVFKALVQNSFRRCALQEVEIHLKTLRSFTISSARGPELRDQLWAALTRINWISKFRKVIFTLAADADTQTVDDAPLRKVVEQWQEHNEQALRTTLQRPRLLARD